MSTKSTRRPAPTGGGTAPAKPAVHHRREAPADHLCTCGRQREECVRDAVRSVWTAA